MEVLVTGVGPVSAIGIGREAFARGLQESVGGIRQVSSFPTARYGSDQATAIDGFNVEEYLESQKAYLDRSSQLAFAAMSLALEDANLDAKSLPADSTGLAFGTAFGCLETMGVFFRDYLEKGPRFVKPVLFPHTYANTTISLLAIEYGLAGPHMCFASRAVAGAQAILCAADWIRQGRAQVCFAGASESLNEVLFAGYDSSKRLVSREAGADACRPLDRRRRGLVLGEGAAVVVLESAGHAIRRGAKALALILGGGTAAGDPSAASGGVGTAMEKALAEAAMTARDLDYISASANGSLDLDPTEMEALQALAAASGGNVPVGSIKSLIGETLGASGPLQMAALVAAMESGRVPPTRNLEEPAVDSRPGSAIPAAGGISAGGGGGCLRFVLGDGLRTEVRTAMMNTIDPGGACVSLVVGRGEGG